MYEPYAFTCHRNEGEYKYPGLIPIGEGDDLSLIEWNIDQIRIFFKPVLDWQNKYKISNNRIFVAEFGGYRYNNGIQKYLKDVLVVLDENKWHWAFYSFREDGWNGMDYELGTKNPSEDYWRAIEAGEMPGLDVYKDNLLFKVVEEALAR